jgi:hypothetical protein
MTDGVGRVGDDDGRVPPEGVETVLTHGNVPTVCPVLVTDTVSVVLEVALTIITATVVRGAPALF